jgi:hypothetical protein
LNLQVRRVVLGAELDAADVAQEDVAAVGRALDDQRAELLGRRQPARARGR